MAAAMTREKQVDELVVRMALTNTLIAIDNVLEGEFDEVLRRSGLDLSLIMLELESKLFFNLFPGDDDPESPEAMGVSERAEALRDCILMRLLSDTGRARLADELIRLRVGDSVA